MTFNINSKYKQIIIAVLLITAMFLAEIITRPTAEIYLINEHPRLNLSSVPWPEYQRPNVSTVAEVEKLGPFDMKTSMGQKRTLEILMKTFKEVMKEANLDGQWFLTAGSLIGSLRHHDFIPWDDDADFMLHLKHRPLVQASLKKLGPTFRTFAHQYFDKLCFAPFGITEELTPESIGSHYETKYPWGWPSIDVAYYENYGNHRFKEFGQPRHKVNLNDIFPLQYRPFGREWFPVPSRPVRFLKYYYRTEQQVCKSHYWRHFSEKWAKSFIEDCRKLMYKYAFVHRCPAPKFKFPESSRGLCDEYLLNGKGEIIHKLQLNLSKEECESPLYTVHHESFICP